MSRRALSLLEVLIAAAVFAALIGLATGSLLGTQRSLAEGAAVQWSTLESQRVAGLLAAELRGLNLSDVDLVPAAPYQSRELKYRSLVGYDPATATPILDPPRATGAYRRVVFDRAAGTIQRVEPGGAMVIARRVADLSLTLVPPDRLRIRVVIERGRGQGKTARGSAESVVTIRNRIP